MFGKPATVVEPSRKAGSSPTNPPLASAKCPSLLALCKPLQNKQQNRSPRLSQPSRVAKEECKGNYPPCMRNTSLTNLTRVSPPPGPQPAPTSPAARPVRGMPQRPGTRGPEKADQMRGPRYEARAPPFFRSEVGCPALRSVSRPAGCGVGASNSKRRDTERKKRSGTS